MCETSQNNFSKSYIVVIDFSSDWFKCVAMRQVWLGERDGGWGGTFLQDGYITDIECFIGMIIFLQLQKAVDKWDIMITLYMTKRVALN